jgi:hypothetical protein
MPKFMSHYTPMFLSAWRLFRKPVGAKYFRPAANHPSCRPQVEALEPRWVPSALGVHGAARHHRPARAATAAYQGPVVHAINYSPTWQGFQPTGSFFDSDFANDAFVGLWGREKGGKPELNPKTNTRDGSRGRNDLATIANEGFNVVRLYNWSPTRRKVGGALDSAHWNFLRYAEKLKPNDGYSQHLGVIVPVSDYFVSNDKFAWSAGNAQGYFDPIKNGKVSYDFDAAPEPIRQNLLDFVKSIKDPKDGKIFDSVFAISVGNEIELGGPSQAPNGTANGAPVGVCAASKLARTEWWMINLERMIQQIPGQKPIRITSPVSTADLGPEGPLSWFQAFIDGVSLGQVVPHATVNPSPANPQQVGGPFAFTGEPANLAPVTGSIPGLTTIAGYEHWYFNTYQAYQDPQGYRNIFMHYDRGGTSSPYQWPGRHFNVPLLITEMGISRSIADPQVAPGDKGAAVDLTAMGQKHQYSAVSAQVRAMEDYLTEHKGKTLNMGYTLFEFTDEPTFKRGAESTFGAEMLAATQPAVSIGPLNEEGKPTPGTYPNTTLLFTAQTENQVFAGGSIPPAPYRVEKLFSVTSDGHPTGTSLLNRLRSIFKREALLRRRRA